MWQLRSPAGDVFFGGLEDGTVFQKLVGQDWSTLVVGPTDLDASYDLLLEMTKLTEMSGGVLVHGPAEFGMDDRVLSDIRDDKRWHSNGPMLLIAFDMTRKVAGKR